MEMPTATDSLPQRPRDPCAMVIFGASGDLTKRKLIPALCNLARDQLLPDNFAVVGVARSELTQEEFRRSTAQEARQYAPEAIKPELWSWLEQRLCYIPGEFQDIRTY